MKPVLTWQIAARHNELLSKPQSTTRIFLANRSTKDQRTEHIFQQPYASMPVGIDTPTHFCSTGDIKPFLMPNTECIGTANGYYTDEAFETYIDFLLDESKGGIPNDGRWRILIVDGYGSHTMVPSVLAKLTERKIWMVTMPSHTSHALQPLDVSCFRPTMYFWSWSLRHLYGIGAFYDVSKYEAPYYFEVALRYGCSKPTIESGFKVTRLYPFNCQWLEENREKFSRTGIR